MVSGMSEAAADLATISSYILQKQHLIPGSSVTDLVRVARDIGGLHNTGPSTPYISLFCRVPGFSRAMLDEEMYVRKRLVRIRCMRNTMHVLPRDLVPPVFAATLKCTGYNAERFCKHRGVSDDEYDVVSGKVVSLLRGGGKTTAEIKRSVGPVTDLPAVLTLLCDRGLLVRGETPNWRSNAYTYHLFEEYLPGLILDSPDEPDATLQLARLYFSAFGPATAEDFAWWSGIGKTKVLGLLKNLPVISIEIPGLGGNFFLLREDLPALRSTEVSSDNVVNLLPGMDPYVMGYKIRDRYISREFYPFVFDRSGNSANTVVINGRLSGVWDCPLDEPLIKFFLFEEADVATRKKIVAEAKRTGKFIHGRPVSVEECRSMVPLTERVAGGVMSPLKGQ
jgi:DNA glycosylase AlkZ-like